MGSQTASALRYLSRLRIEVHPMTDLCYHSCCRMRRMQRCGVVRCPEAVPSKDTAKQKAVFLFIFDTGST